MRAARRLPGQHQRDLDVPRALRPLRAPWPADNAIERAAAGVARARRAAARRRTRSTGSSSSRSRASRGSPAGSPSNVIPDRVECHVNFRYAPGRSAGRGRGAAGASCAPATASCAIDANAPSGPVAAGPRVDALVAAGDLVRAPKQAWTPVAEFGLAGLPAVNFGPGEPAQAHRRDESVEIAALVAGLRGPGAVRGMRVAPALTGMQTYPFVRLAEAKRRLLAAGRRPDRLRHRRAARGDAAPSSARRSSPRSSRSPPIPPAEGLPELRAAVAAWTRRRFGARARPGRAGAADARLQGGDLPPGPGARRRAASPSPRPRTRSTSAARCSRARRSSSCRCTEERGFLPDLDAVAAEHVARRRAPVAQLPEQPDRRDRAAARSTSRPRRSPASTASSSPPTRPTPSSTSATSRPPRRCSSPTCAACWSSTRSPSAPRCPATAPASWPATRS